MTAPVSVIINGSAVTTLDESTVVIDQILGTTIDTATIRIFDKNASITVPEGKDIVISRPDTGAVIFGGLTSLVDGWLDGRSRWWEIKAQDYTTILDSTIVFASYTSGWSDQDMIADLFANRVVSPGPASEINATTYVNERISSMAAIFFNYVTLREAMQTICNYSGSNHYVDGSKNLHYFYLGEEDSGFALKDAPDTSHSPPWVGYRNIRWRRDASQLKNYFYIFGNNLFSSPQTYILPADGVQTTIYLGVDSLGMDVFLAPEPGYSQIRVWHNNGSDAVPDWEPSGNGLTVYDYVDGSFTGPEFGADVLFSQTGQFMLFSFTPSNLTQSVKIGACFQYSSSQTQSNGASYTKYGRYLAKKITANDANSANSLTQIVAAYDKELAFALNKVTVTVDDQAFNGVTTERFTTGKRLYLWNTLLGLSDYFWTHRVTTRIEGGELRSYELELRNWCTT